MARILLIDDDPSLLDILLLEFEDAGHDVCSARDGALGWQRLKNDPPYDLVVSDVNMPGVDGFSLCRRVREAGLVVPILLLTGRDTEVDEALGLELGADDFVTKPFSTRVLLARCSALLRRDAMRRAPPQKPATVTLGDLSLDPERMEVRYQDVPVDVTVTEFRLLEALTRRPGVVFSRDRLLELARGDDSVVAPRIIDTYVRRLRRKFELVDASFSAIDTVVGAGYRWRER
jgi:DNA-binding response OmpR family regulator